MATGDKIVNLDDLKAVHDFTQGQVGELKSALNSELNPINLEGWELGSYNSTNGNYYASTGSIRNVAFAGISLGTERITVDDGYKMLLFAWDDSGNFVGSLKTGYIFDTTTANYLLVSEFDCALYPTYKYKITMQKVPASTDITAADGAHCHLYNTTDTTLSVSGKAADAKAVGDLLSENLLDKIETVNPVNWYNPSANTSGKIM